MEWTVHVDGQWKSMLGKLSGQEMERVPTMMIDTYPEINRYQGTNVNKSTVQAARKKHRV